MDTPFKELYGNNQEYELIDIGQQLKHYDESMATEATPEYATGAACNLDSTGC